MKKHRKTPIIVFAIFVLLVTTLSGCKEQDKSYGQDVMQEAVKVRFDRQNTVYYELAQQVEEYISEDRTVAEAEFRSFCLGVNCFIRDESRVDWDNLYQDDVSKTITEIMSMTAKTEMETLRLSSLSETELERLMTNFYDLSEHNRINRPISNKHTVFHLKQFLAEIWCFSFNVMRDFD